MAKASVVFGAAVYFVGLYFESRRGADLNQGALLQLLVPFVLVFPAAIVAHLAYFVSRRSQRVGDIAFSVVIIATCILLTAFAYAN